MQRGKRERWIVKTASFISSLSSLYLCKDGFAMLDWGTSSCVLTVCPCQTKPMSTKNPEITKIQVKAICLDFTCFSKFAKGGKREMNSKDGFFYIIIIIIILVQRWVCHVGLRDLLLCSRSGRFKNQNHVEKKPGNYNNSDRKHIDFICLDLTCKYFSKFTKGEKERDEKFRRLFLSLLRVQTWVCQVGLRDLLLCSRCGPKPCRAKTRKSQKTDWNMLIFLV